MPNFKVTGSARSSEKISASASDSLSSKSPYAASTYSGRGVWDLTNLFEFAPYESGYCFLGVISSPRCMEYDAYNLALQEAFVKMLENEFKGLDGIEDLTSENLDISDNISTMSYIGKTNQQSNGTFTMRFTEKCGSLITKYISRFLRTIKDGRTQVKTYDGHINTGNVEEVGPWQEVFNFLYIVTDSTCLRVEKAFLILNAQPTTAAYSELYNMERGNIEVKELSVPFNGFVVEGDAVDGIAKSYVEKLVNLTSAHDDNKINLNSSDFNYSFSNNGEIHNIKSIGIKL